MTSIDYYDLCHKILLLLVYFYAALSTFDVFKEKSARRSRKKEREFTHVSSENPLSSNEASYSGSASKKGRNKSEEKTVNTGLMRRVVRALKLWLLLSSISLLSVLGAHHIVFFSEVRLILVSLITLAPWYTQEMIFDRFYQPLMTPLHLFINQL